MCTARALDQRKALMNRLSQTIPRTIEDVLDCAITTPADGLTAPACGNYFNFLSVVQHSAYITFTALWDYYQKKTVVKFFIVVTDGK